MTPKMAEEVWNCARLKTGEETTVNWRQDSGGRVIRAANGTLALFEVTQYGMNEYYDCSFEHTEAQALVEYVYRNYI